MKVIFKIRNLWVTFELFDELSILCRINFLEFI